MLASLDELLKASLGELSDDELLEDGDPAEAVTKLLWLVLALLEFACSESV